MLTCIKIIVCVDFIAQCYFCLNLMLKLLYTYRPLLPLSGVHIAIVCIDICSAKIDLKLFTLLFNLILLMLFTKTY